MPLESTSARKAERDLGARDDDPWPPLSVRFKFCHSLLLDRTVQQNPVEGRNKDSGGVRTQQLLSNDLLAQTLIQNDCALLPPLCGIFDYLNDLQSASCICSTDDACILVPLDRPDAAVPSMLVQLTFALPRVQIVKYNTTMIIAAYNKIPIDGARKC